MNFAATFESPLGLIELRSVDGFSLSALRFVEQSSADDRLSVFDEATKWLRRYFAGENPKPILSISPIGTEFQKRVWQELLTVTYGERITYGKLARRVGCSSARAVGQAVGANPLLLLIPCHRVIAENGIGGFAAGIDRKIALLALEGNYKKTVRMASGRSLYT